MSDLITSPKRMKQEILKSIRSALLELENATKAELSEKLDISFPTISKFLAQMEKEGELLVVGLDDSSGGRRAKRYAYNPEHMLGLAIFLEKTETHYTIFNCAGEVKEQGEAPSVLLADSLEPLTECIKNLMAAYPKISSLSIGVPGSVDRGKIIFIPGYEHFKNLDLKTYYEELLSVPVVVENDMNAAVLGYHTEKDSGNRQSLVYLYTGQNGPGAGIMVNGDVVRGSSFFSGEVSFIPLYNDRNFGQALDNEGKPKKIVILEEGPMDAVSRFVSSFTAILNPHTIIFCNDEFDEMGLNQLAIGSSKYIPLEHLPKLTLSDWRIDYLHGLQSLGLDLMITPASKWSN